MSIGVRQPGYRFSYYEHAILGSIESIWQKARFIFEPSSRLINYSAQ